MDRLPVRSLTILLLKIWPDHPKKRCVVASPAREEG